MTTLFRLWLCLLLLCPLAALDAQGSDTLSALKSDLATGSLKPLLARQSLLGLPEGILNRWLADSHFQQFAITGFNENGQRFAARLRLIFSNAAESGGASGVTFIRLGGTSGADYRIDQFHDYVSGLDLGELVEEREWLLSTGGKRFLKTLSREPGSDALADMAGGRAVALSLWLAQCGARPCESTALQAQQATDTPAVWELQRAFIESDRDAQEAALASLRRVLGDDPWLWHLTGLYARQYGHCAWVAGRMQSVWLTQTAQQGNRQLADSTLQCTLAIITDNTAELDHQGTAFLDQLSQVTGQKALSRAIISYFKQQGRVCPDALGAWIVGS